MLERFKVPLAAHVLLIDRGRILLLKRVNTLYLPGFYTDPAGHIENNESAIQAAVRECGEETGLTVEPKNLKLVHVVHTGPVISGDIYLHLFFLTTTWVGQLKPGDPQCEELNWYELNHLPVPIVPEVESAIKNFQHIPYSEVSW